MAPRCRPPYEEQNARISILVNGIAGRPDTFVQTVLGQPQKPLADGAAILRPDTPRVVAGGGLNQPYREKSSSGPDVDRFLPEQ